MNADTLDLWMAWSDERHAILAIYGVARTREDMEATIRHATQEKIRPVRVSVHVGEEP